MVGKLARSTILWSIITLCLGFWAGRQYDPSIMDYGNDDSVKLSQKFGDAVAKAAADVDDAIDNADPQDKPALKRMRIPLQKIGEHAAAKVIAEAANQLDVEQVDDGKHGFIIAAGLLAAGIAALVKKLIAMLVMAMIWKWIMTHLAYVGIAVLAICVLVFLVSWKSGGWSGWMSGRRAAEALQDQYRLQLQVKP